MRNWNLKARHYDLLARNGAGFMALVLALSPFVFESPTDRARYLLVASFVGFVVVCSLLVLKGFSEKKEDDERTADQAERDARAEKRHTDAMAEEASQSAMLNQHLTLLQIIETRMPMGDPSIAGIREAISATQGAMHRLQAEGGVYNISS
jgi:hypothetical protein